MTKTTHYNLNKPEAGDPIRVTDFNQNSDIIDAALAAKADQSVVNALNSTVAAKLGKAEVDAQIAAAMNGRILFGSYTGDGLNERFIDMGCTPTLVILITENPTNILFCIVSAEFAYYSYSGSSSGSSAATTRITDGGVTIYSGTNNTSGMKSRYIAIL